MTRVIGHRGASKDFPENTGAAFEGARVQGADWVELDVRRTNDGYLVIHHDPVLADGRVICETQFADLPDWMLTLKGALDACQPMGVNVEIKNSPDEPGYDPTYTIARLTVEAIESHPAGLDILISSFDLPTIAAVRSMTNSPPTGYLVLSATEPIDAVAAAVDGGHCAINPWNPLVTAAEIERAHAAGIDVNVWTVDDPDRMRELAAWGADSIITNCPSVAVSVLAG